MVHARSFSFTDDAISVALPTAAQPTSASLIDDAPADSSMHLFKLRQLQSNWYQTLSQGNPNDPLPDATSYVWRKCLEMRQWFEALPAKMPAYLREMLGLELQYSYVYCIAPTARAPQITPYGRMLIFEHAISYINRIHQVTTGTANIAFYTYHDALRVYFMGSQFVAVLRDAADMLLSGQNVPAPITAPGRAPPPPVPERFGQAIGFDNLDRSLQTLERVSDVLREYGKRWDSALALMATFENMSAEVLGNLKQRVAIREEQHQARRPLVYGH